MATRQAYDATASSVLTATNLDKHAGGWIGYVQVVASQATITTVTDVTSLTLTVTANASRYHKITGKVDVLSTVSGDTVDLAITDGSNVQKNRSASAAMLATSGTSTMFIMGVETGWSGSTTRKLRIQRSSGSGSVTMFASNDTPAFLLIEDMGSA